MVGREKVAYFPILPKNHLSAPLVTDTLLPMYNVEYHGL